MLTNSPPIGGKATFHDESHNAKLTLQACTCMFDERIPCAVSGEMSGGARSGCIPSFLQERKVREREEESLFLINPQYCLFWKTPHLLHRLGETLRRYTVLALFAVVCSPRSPSGYASWEARVQPPQRLWSSSRLSMCHIRRKTARSSQREHRTARGLRQAQRHMSSSEERKARCRLCLLLRHREGHQHERCAGGNRFVLLPTSRVVRRMARHVSDPPRCTRVERRLPALPCARQAQLTLTR
jgi:hypothetical protein